MPRKIQLQTLSEERLDPFHFQYPSPFPVWFEDDDALIHDKGSLHSAWLLANDFASVFDDETSDTTNQSDIYDEIDEFVVHKLYLESQAYQKAPFLTRMEDVIASNSKPKRINRHRLCCMIGCPGLGGDIYCPKFNANLPKKNDSLITLAPVQKISTLASADKSSRKRRQCRVCRRHGPKALHLNCLTGSWNRSRCKNFFIGGGRKCAYCQAYDPKGPDCWAGVNQTICKRFELHGTPKVLS